MTPLTDVWKHTHTLTTLKARAGAGSELVSAKYFSQEKFFSSGYSTVQRV